METNIQPNAPIASNLPPATISSLPQTGIPIGGKIIAILHYLVSIFLIFLGIMIAFVGAWTLSSVTEFFGLGFGLSTSIIPGLLAIAWGLIHFATGRGLWTGKEWGQILAITVSGLYIAVGVINLVMFGGGNYFVYIGLALHFVIILYLLLNKKIHDAFPYGSSGNTGVILAIVAIVIYGAISTMSIIYKNKAVKFAQDFTAGLKEELARTDQALKTSGMNCKFYEYKDYNEKYTPLSIQTGNGIYTNSIYGVQINLGQPYTVKELRGTNYCEHKYVFYDSQGINGAELAVLSVEPAKGDLNYYYDKYYKTELFPTSRLDIKIAGQDALKTVETLSNANSITYRIIFQGKLYTLHNGKQITDGNFETMAGSIQLTK